MVLSIIDEVKSEFGDVEIREWNLAEHPELGPRYGVTAAPAIVINGRLQFRGVPSSEAFRARLTTLARAHGD